MGDGSEQHSHRYEIQNALGAERSDDEKIALVGKWLDAKQPAARAFWQFVLDQSGGTYRIGTWVFVAEPEKVVRVLHDDQRFLVTEYDRRMRATSGRFFLGMDGDEHRRDREIGRIIPSWNDPNAPTDLAVLERVAHTAERAARQVLASAGMRTDLARITDPEAKCQLELGELLGVVLDASASQYFGVRGPSSVSLVAWAKDITWYHFRFYANDEEDRARALAASAQYRAHVVASIAKLPPGDVSSPLGRAVSGIRCVLMAKTPGSTPSDDDLARNLIGIITGSLTATAKTFGEALAIFFARASLKTGQPFAWPTANDSVPHGSKPHFPLYDAVVATSLVAAQRGGIDSLYRMYQAENAADWPELKKGDRIVAWLGGTLPGNADRLFGIGVHRCPGMDMGKAIMEGILRALTAVPKPPKLSRSDTGLRLTFDQPSVLAGLGREAQS